MSEQRQQAPVTATATQASAHNLQADGISLPAVPLAVQLKSYTAENPSPRAAMPPPAPVAQLVPMQPPAAPSEKKPFQLPARDAALPPRQEVPSWSATQLRGVVQRVPVSLPSRSGDKGYDPDLYVDTRDLYENYRNPEGDKKCFDPERYPNTEAALLEAREKALRMNRQQELKQIEEMLIEIYNHGEEEFATGEEEEEEEESTDEEESAEEEEEEEEDAPPEIDMEEPEDESQEPPVNNGAMQQPGNDGNSQEDSQHNKRPFEKKEEEQQQRKRPRRLIQDESDGGEAPVPQPPVQDGSQKVDAAPDMDVQEEVKKVRKPHYDSIGIVTWNVEHFSDKETVKKRKQRNKGEDDWEQDEEEDDVNDETYGEDMYEEIEESEDDIVDADEDEAVIEDDEEHSSEEKQQPVADEPVIRKDFMTQLNEVLEKFRKVISEWDGFCNEIKELEVTIEKGVKAEENKKLLKGKMEAVDSIQAKIASAVEDLGECSESLESVQVYVDWDWNKAYEEALADMYKKVPLAQMAKAFRKEGLLFLREASFALRSVGFLWTDKKKMTDLIQALSKDGVASIRQKFTTIRKQLGQSALKELPRVLHAHNIAVQVNTMFENNDWLDVMILQEVNDPSLLRNADAPYTMHEGPRMESGGENPQRENYPILIRKDSGFTVTNIFYVGTDGKRADAQLKEEEDEHKNEPYKRVDWDKGEKNYRPIMVYELERPRKGADDDKKEKIWVGVVHTTPESNSGVAEFNRTKIYDEINAGLKTLHDQSRASGIPLIIGGDYYLTAEAVVKPAEQPGTKDDPSVKKMEEATKARFDELSNAQAAYAALLEDVHAVRTLTNEINRLERDFAKRINPDQRKKSKHEELVKDELEKQRKIYSKHGVNSPEELDAYWLAQKKKQADITNDLKMITDARSPHQVLRNEKKTTMAAEIERHQLTLAQPLSGTNPKEKPLTEWEKLQIADFYVTRGMGTNATGIMRPEGKMVSIDRDDLHYSKYWQHFSDHFPIGGVFAIAPKDEESVQELLSEAFVTDEKAVVTAKQANINMLAFKFIKNELNALLSEKEKSEEDEETRGDRMTAKALSDKIKALEAQYNLKVLDDKAYGKEELIAHFNTLKKMIETNHPEAKITLPNNEELAKVYLDEIKSRKPDIQLPESFDKERLGLALRFLLQRLEKIAAVIKTADKGPEKMDTGEDQLQALIEQVKAQEAELVRQGKMKAKDQLVLFRPEDVEPESSDPAIAPKEQKAPVYKAPPKPVLTEEQQALINELIEVIAAGQDVVGFMTKFAPQLAPIYQGRSHELLDLLGGNDYVLNLFMKHPEPGILFILMLEEQYGIKPEQLFAGLAEKIKEHFKVVAETAVILLKMDKPAYAEALVLAVLRQLHGKMLIGFMDLLQHVFQHGRPSEVVIEQLINKLQTEDELIKRRLVEFLLSMRWVEKEAMTAYLRIEEQERFNAAANRNTPPQHGNMDIAENDEQVNNKGKNAVIPGGQQGNPEENKQQKQKQQKPVAYLEPEDMYDSNEEMSDVDDYVSEAEVDDPGTGSQGENVDMRHSSDDDSGNQ